MIKNSIKISNQEISKIQNQISQFSSSSSSHFSFSTNHQNEDEKSSLSFFKQILLSSLFSSSSSQIEFLKDSYIYKISFNQNQNNHNQISIFQNDNILLGLSCGNSNSNFDHSPLFIMKKQQNNHQNEEIDEKFQQFIIKCENNETFYQNENYEGENGKMNFNFNQILNNFYQFFSSSFSSFDSIYNTIFSSFYQQPPSLSFNNDKNENDDKIHLSHNQPSSYDHNLPSPSSHIIKMVFVNGYKCHLGKSGKLRKRDEMR